MSRVVRCGLIQAKTPLDGRQPLSAIKKAMIDKHLKLIEQAARKKVKILCLQELFYGPYFCAEQNPRWYELTERVPDGPTTKLMSGLIVMPNCITSLDGSLAPLSISSADERGRDPLGTAGKMPALH